MQLMERKKLEDIKCCTSQEKIRRSQTAVLYIMRMMSQLYSQVEYLKRSPALKILKLLVVPSMKYSPRSQKPSAHFTKIVSELRGPTFE